MQPFYRIGLRHSPPSAATILGEIGADAGHSLVDVTDRLDFTALIRELGDLGCGVQSAVVRRWQFQDHRQSQPPGHTEISWSLTRGSVLDFFSVQGGEQFLVQQGSEWQTTWLWPSLPEPPITATWDSYGPVIIDTQQPHRARSLTELSPQRVTLSLILQGTYGQIQQQLTQQQRIRS